MSAVHEVRTKQESDTDNCVLQIRLRLKPLQGNELSERPEGISESVSFIAELQRESTFPEPGFLPEERVKDVCIDSAC